MEINKEENVLVTGYNGGSVTGKANFKIITQEEANEKLHKILNIEEEIGIDFITLFKALKHGIYINDGGIVDEIGNIYEAEIKCIEHWPVWGFSVGTDEMKTFYAFKDRGKTWALYKEEFYENIK